MMENFSMILTPTHTTSWLSWEVSSYVCFKALLMLWATLSLVLLKSSSFLHFNPLSWTGVWSVWVVWYRFRPDRGLWAAATKFTDKKDDHCPPSSDCWTFVFCSCATAMSCMMGHGHLTLQSFISKHAPTTTLSVCTEAFQGSSVFLRRELPILSAVLQPCSWSQQRRQTLWL